MIKSKLQFFLIPAALIFFVQTVHALPVLSFPAINTLYREKNYNLCALEAGRFLFFNSFAASYNQNPETGKVKLLLIKSYLKQGDEKSALLYYKKNYPSFSFRDKKLIWQHLFFYTLEQERYNTAEFFLKKLYSQKELSSGERADLRQERIRLERLRGNYRTAGKLNSFLPAKERWKSEYLMKAYQPNLTRVLIASLLFPGGGHYYHKDYKNGFLSTGTVLGLSFLSYYFIKKDNAVLGIFSGYFAFVFFQDSILLALRREYLYTRKKNKELQNKILLASKYHF